MVFPSDRHWNSDSMPDCCGSTAVASVASIAFQLIPYSGPIGNKTNTVLKVLTLLKSKPTSTVVGPHWSTYGYRQPAQSRESAGGCSPNV